MRAPAGVRAVCACTNEFCAQVYTFVEYSATCPLIWVIKDGKAADSLLDNCQNTLIMLQFLKNREHVRTVVFRTFMTEFKRSHKAKWLEIVSENYRAMYNTILERQKLESRQTVICDLDAMGDVDDDDEEEDDISRYLSATINQSRQTVICDLDAMGDVDDDDEEEEEDDISRYLNINQTGSS